MTTRSWWPRRRYRIGILSFLLVAVLIMYGFLWLRQRELQYRADFSAGRFALAQVLPLQTGESVTPAFVVEQYEITAGGATLDTVPRRYNLAGGCHAFARPESADAVYAATGVDLPVGEVFVWVPPYPGGAVNVCVKQPLMRVPVYLWAGVDERDR